MKIRTYTQTQRLGHWWHIKWRMHGVVCSSLAQSRHNWGACQNIQLWTNHPMSTVLAFWYQSTVVPVIIHECWTFTCHLLILFYQTRPFWCPREYCWCLFIVGSSISSKIKVKPKYIPLFPSKWLVDCRFQLKLFNAFSGFHPVAVHANLNVYVT